MLTQSNNLPLDQEEYPKSDLDLVGDGVDPESEYVCHPLMSRSEAFAGREQTTEGAWITKQYFNY